MKQQVRLAVVFVVISSCAVVASQATAVGGENETRTGDAPSVFDLPALQLQHAAALQAVTGLFAQGKYEQAESILRAMIERMPHESHARYNLACALARQDKSEEALSALAKAVELGFRDAAHIAADEDLKKLRENARFQEILKQAGEPLEAGAKPGWRYRITPAEIREGRVLVSASNTAWNTQLGVFQVFFKLDRQATADKPIAVGLKKAGDLLRLWTLEGSAAGNHGDLYDNRDGDHSTMDYESLPQLTRIELGEEIRKRELHFGVQLLFLYNGITIGNSSTALTSGFLWRSQARMALTQSRGPRLLYLQYVSNHLYFYPEHRDHDPRGADKRCGDLLPANTPYMIISQGSSGSDRAFMNAVGATLAAFRPEVKQKLAQSGTLMAAVQMIFRSSSTMLDTPADYLTGKAHPTVFDREQLNVEKMVTAAHQMTADTLPPMVQLQVLEEDEPVVGRDYFDVASRERLADTPCAIARVVKSTQHDRRMVVSAEGSKDLHAKPLTYHWVVLRGDPTRIRINKLNDTGSKAELIVGYHERRPIAPGSDLDSTRVDIGVFVHNGQYYSAPGFVCFHYLDNEKRVYDDQYRIQVVDYTDASVRDNYVDPLVDHRKDWRDEYHWSNDGTLLGWTRVRGDSRQEFTAEGRLVLARDAAGKVTETAPVRYQTRQAQGEAPALEQVQL